MNTLAKERKKTSTQNESKVFGIGHNVKREKARERRDKTKLIGNALAIALAEVAEIEKDKKLINADKELH